MSHDLAIAIARHREMIFRNLQQIQDHGLFAEFMPSCMAAGPCAKATEVDGDRFLALNAPLVPFDDCQHPDQCACIYRACLTLHD